MRKQFRCSSGIVAVGIGAIAAVSMALLVPAGAGAAQTTPSTTITTKAPTLLELTCAKLPGLLQTVTDGLVPTGDAVTAAQATVDTTRAAMTTAITDLATAIANHLAALDGNGNSAATGVILKGKQARYVDSVVAWSKARTVLFDSERQLVFGELQQTVLGSVEGNACP